jgi:hypothetical protein
MEYSEQTPISPTSTSNSTSTWFISRFFSPWTSTIISKLKSNTSIYDTTDFNFKEYNNNSNNNSSNSNNDNNNNIHHSGLYYSKQNSTFDVNSV